MPHKLPVTSKAITVLARPFSPKDPTMASEPAVSHHRRGHSPPKIPRWPASQPSPTIGESILDNHLHHSSCSSQIQYNLLYRIVHQPIAAQVYVANIPSVRTAAAIPQCPRTMPAAHPLRMRILEAPTAGCFSSPSVASRLSAVAPRLRTRPRKRQDWLWDIVGHRPGTGLLQSTRRPGSVFILTGLPSSLHIRRF
ncbi:hypothetical protein B0I35DRAFT_90026 [Stachybotrys elegans]|uniref:Uncharacterized protein n=1 Tax=Stachybotrys elegans TaxID=80388 RepID=A0A8K0WM39_9HYPO|nr:hypothetical protein B0I35DRAFT_90026 [Stachybotrys elegans]